MEPQWVKDWWEQGIDPHPSREQKYHGWKREAIEASANRKVSNPILAMAVDACRRKIREWKAEDNGKLLIEVTVDTKTIKDLLVYDDLGPVALTLLRDAIVENRKGNQ